MRIEAHDHLSQPVSVPITRIVVFDDFDTPVSMSIALDHGLVHTSRLGDPEFPHMLQMLGINYTTVINEIEVKRPR